jgi:S1-C subfamily serine protease
MNAKHWLTALACAFGILALLVNIKVEAAEGTGWGIDAINDYVDKANVLVGDENGDFCSGTIISIKNRFILTADHCIKGRVRREEREFVDPVTGEVTRRTIEKRLELVVSERIVKDYEVVSRQSFTARIWARDAEHDVAILQIVDKDYAPAYAATLAPEGYDLNRGETVYVVGNPGIELDNSITKGIVSATERTLDFGDGKKLKVFQIDAVAIGGNSGGSVLNDAGQIVGTLSAGLRGAGINFVVPISATRKLLKDKGFKDADGPGIVIDSPAKIDEKSASALTPRVNPAELDDLTVQPVASWIGKRQSVIARVAR